MPRDPAAIAADAVIDLLHSTLDSAEFRTALRAGLSSALEAPPGSAGDEFSDVLTAAEVAALTGRHVETVTQALRDGELRGRQRSKGGRWSVRKADALAWIVGDAS